MMFCVSFDSFIIIFSFNQDIEFERWQVKVKIFEFNTIYY